MRHPQPGSEAEAERFAELQVRLEPLYRRVFATAPDPRRVRR